MLGFCKLCRVTDTQTSNNRRLPFPQHDLGREAAPVMYWCICSYEHQVRSFQIMFVHTSVCASFCVCASVFLFVYLSLCHLCLSVISVCLTQYPSNLFLPVSMCPSVSLNMCGHLLSLSACPSDSLSLLLFACLCPCLSGCVIENTSYNCFWKVQRNCY